MEWEQKSLEDSIDSVSETDDYNWFLYVNKRLIDINNGVESPGPMQLLHELDFPYQLALMLLHNHQPHLV